MGRINGDLDLHLHRSFPHSSLASRLDLNSMNEDEMDQQMTIFFNGRVCVSDAIELQARAIICSATRGIETGINIPVVIGGPSTNTNTTTRFFHKLQLHGLPGCSIKRSLKLFLQQKRRRRLLAQAQAAPYSYRRQ